MDNTIEDIEYEGKREKLSISSWGSDMIELTIEINQDFPDPSFLLDMNDVVKLSVWLNSWIHRYAPKCTCQNHVDFSNCASFCKRRIAEELEAL